MQVSGLTEKVTTVSLELRAVQQALDAKIHEMDALQAQLTITREAAASKERASREKKSALKAEVERLKLEVRLFTRVLSDRLQ